MNFKVLENDLVQAIGLGVSTFAVDLVATGGFAKSAVTAAAVAAGRAVLSLVGGFAAQYEVTKSTPPNPPVPPGG